MIRSYLRLVLFALGLLVGVQVPGFIHSYAQHVEARRLESAEALRGFTLTAQRFFRDDLQALVEYYRASEDPVFRSDAQSVETVVSRYQLLEGEARAMRGPWYRQAWHLATRADHELRREAWRGYGFQVLLRPAAVAWGIACALVFAWFAEGLWLLLTGPVRRYRQQRTPRP
ncbi:DUF2937 family protein [Stutzerimonas tarimensis]|uniref:DUF2937 family protein n=1 Tax=Stutzerimonas tarimensis TaxID=1507735 RepID=A0ABV7T444_9GAMM